MIAAASGCGRIGFDLLPLDEGDAGGDPDATVHVDRDAAVPDAGADAGITPIEGTVGLVAGIQSTTASFVARFRYEPGAAAAESITVLPSVRLDELASDGVRGLARLGEAEVLAGDGYRARVLRIDAATGLVTATLGLVGSVGNVHSLCPVDDGLFAVGEYTGGASASVGLHRLGDDLVETEVIYSTVVPGGAMSKCQALSPTELLLSDANQNDDSDGDVVRLRDDGAGWQQVARVDTSAFVPPGISPNHGPSMSSFVLAEDGMVYMFPVRRSGDRIDRLVRCPASLDAAACTLLAELPPDGGGEGYSGDLIQASVVVPGAGQVVFGTSRSLFRYRIADDTVEEIVDLWADLDDLELADGQSAGVVAIRNVVVVP